MKLLSILFLVGLLSSCNQEKTHAPDTTVINPNAATNSIVPENNACICTKEYAPVCAENNRTYPNACQAKCEGMKDLKEGPCN